LNLGKANREELRWKVRMRKSDFSVRSLALKGLHREFWNNLFQFKNVH